MEEKKLRIARKKKKIITFVDEKKKKFSGDVQPVKQKLDGDKSQSSK